MPIYEYYCEPCHTIYQFWAKTLAPAKAPACPQCGHKKLKKELSLFAITGQAKEEGGMDDLPFDEAKMERAMMALEREAGTIDENDPKQAARLMRKLGDMTGMEFGDGMREAMRRMEAGEDPDAIEAEMGDLLEEEDPFGMLDQARAYLQQGGAGTRRGAPKKDPTLYEM